MPFHAQNFVIGDITAPRRIVAMFFEISGLVFKRTPHLPGDVVDGWPAICQSISLFTYPAIHLIYIKATTILSMTGWNRICQLEPGSAQGDRPPSSMAKSVPIKPYPVAKERPSYYVLHNQLFAC